MDAIHSFLARDAFMTRGLLATHWIAMGCLAIWIAGCGSNDTTPDTYPVSGKVTVDGAPLPSGRIFFEDIPKGINNAAEIANGEYSGQAAAGDLKVRIVKTEKIKSPMGLEEIDKETELKRDHPVTIQTGDNKLPTIDITSSR